MSDSRSQTSAGTSTFLFAGGGTGGHITPGLAVAEQIVRQRPGARILFQGAGRDVEQRLVGAAGYELLTTSFPSSLELRRRPVRSAWRAWSALRLARSMLRSQHVSAVIGLGGFASIPAALGAKSAGIPLVLLEQNVIPGRSVEWFARRADLVCGSFEETGTSLPRGTRYINTGNPVRSEIAVIAWPDFAARADLVILGGSQGAESLNTAVLDLIISGEIGKWPGGIIHQTGTSDLERVRAAYAGAGIAARVEPFFADMVSVYQRARLAISRAGATTLAELAMAGCPAILAPYPHATRDHQRFNAEWYAARGAALVADFRSGATALREPFRRLIETGQRLEEWSRAMLATARPEAAIDVARHLLAMTEP